MFRPGFWWAVALVVASNFGAWGAVALNRSGEPEAVLELTERELQLPARQADNTALGLTLVFERQRAPGRPFEPSTAGWFDRDTLQSIGFDCSRPVVSENASFYRVQPPRSTYAALEYEGDAWRRRVQEPLPGPEQAAGGPGAGAPPDGPARETRDDRQLESHLVAIDVANDPGILRERYPDRRRVAIVSATATLSFISNPGQPPFLAGRLIWVLPREINVPHQWHRLLAELQTDRGRDTAPPPLREPRFRATVAWGKNLEPWIVDVQPMGGTLVR